MVFAFMGVRVGMRRAIGMGVRMFMSIVRVSSIFVAMAVAVCRAIFMHVPVAGMLTIVLVIVSLDGFALYARLADGTSTSGTHCSAPPVSCLAAWSLNRTNRPRVL
jgi:hypothetical protein